MTLKRQFANMPNLWKDICWLLINYVKHFSMVTVWGASWYLEITSFFGVKNNQHFLYYFGADEDRMAQDNCSTEMTTILVNGCNKGIGLDFAKICLKEHDNLSLILCCRNLNRIVKFDANKTRKQLRKDPELSNLYNV